MRKMDIHKMTSYAFFRRTKSLIECIKCNEFIMVYIYIVL